MTIDEEQKLGKDTSIKKKRKVRKTSGDDLQLKFDSLMNAGQDMNLDMRLMESKLRKIKKNTVKKKFKLKSILKAHDLTQKKKPK